MTELLLRVDEVADLLGVSPRVVRHLLARGDLAGVNVGLGSEKPRWRVTREALNDFIERRGAA